MAASNAIREEYLSSLADLDQNSKPMIDMLTMLADDHRQHAPIIVDAIKERITQVRQKLPILYLIDSIVKNVGQEYKQLFQQEIVGIFVDVFEKSRNDKIREKMFALRETWKDVFLQTKLYMMDVKVNQIDPNWPIVAKVTKNPKIHVNPNFLKKIEPVVDPIEQLKQEVLEKQRKLLELQKCKLELEMRETAKKIEEEQRKRALESSSTTTTTPTAVHGGGVPSSSTSGGGGGGKSVKVSPVGSALIASVGGGAAAGKAARAAGSNKKESSKSSSSSPKKSSSSSSTSPKSSSKSKSGGSSSRSSSSHHHSGGSSSNKDRKRSSKRSSDESAEKSSPTKRSRSSGSESVDGDKKAKHAAVMSKRIPKLSSAATSTTTTANQALVRDTDDRIVPPVMTTSPLSQKDSTATTASATNQKLFLDAAATDVDLRPFMPMPPSNVGDKMVDTDERELVKKQQHSSADLESHEEIDQEPPFAKRSKSEKFDILFGSNDVDLRAMGANNNHSNNTSHLANEKDGWSKIKGDTPKRGPAPKTNFEAIKSRIQEASKAKKKRFDERIIDRKPQPLLDVDLRATAPSQATAGKSIDLDDNASQDALDSSIQIIMAQAQEQLDNEAITADQYQSMVQQVIQLNETKKIREAERMEKQNGDAPAEQVEVSSSDSDSEEEFRDYRRKKADRWGHVQNRHHGGMDNNKPGAVGPQFGPRMDMRRKPWEPPHMNMGMQRPGPPGNWRGRPPFGNRDPWMNGSGGGRFMGGPQQFNNRMPPCGPPPLPPPPAMLNQPPLLRMGNQVRGPREAPSTIDIDKVNREIRFYDNIAIVFMDWDQPREIGFQPGTRRISCDDQWSMNLVFNAPNVTWMIDGRPHQVRLGAPTRELYIDNEWYECFIDDDGDPCRIELNGKVRTLKIDGPKPEVRIGELRRDLVAGKISIIIDAKVMVPVYLDSREQQFEVDGIVHTLQFADYFLTVLINKVRVAIEFGGLPKSFFVNGQKHFMRFTALPPNVIPGQFSVRGMIRTQEYRNIPSPPMPPSTMLLPPVMHNMVMSHPPPPMMHHQQLPPSLSIPPPATAAGNLSNGLDMLTNILPGLASPQIPMLGQEQQQSVGYNLENNGQQKSSGDGGGGANPLGNVNVNDLFQKLLATGILGKTGNEAKVDSNEKESSQSVTTEKGGHNNNNFGAGGRRKNFTRRGGGRMGGKDTMGGSGGGGGKADEKPAVAPASQDASAAMARDLIVPVDLAKAASIKTRQQAIVQQVYLGMQCSSCGVRFPPEQTMKYSQHLDWHFRQNRRDRDSVRKAHSRKWFYDVNNWIQYEEIEDLEEREKNWFETQQSEEMGQDEAHLHGDGVMPSCPAGPTEGEKICEVCHEPFDQFYNEETEEWHLRPAIRVEERIYHPICYEDYKMSLRMDESQISEGNADSQEEGEKAVKTELKQENGDEDGNSSKMLDQSTDNDDDVIVLPMDAPSITEILDDDEELAAAAAGAVDGDKRSPRPLGIDDEGDKDSNGEASMDVVVDTSKITMPLPGVVHIKTEPKDDGYNEEDAFMDVGTIEPIDETMEEDAEGENGEGGEPRDCETLEQHDDETVLTVDTSEGNRESPETIALDSPLTPGQSQLGLDVEKTAPVVSILTNKIKINISKLASSSVMAEGNTDSRESVHSSGVTATGTTAAEKSGEKEEQLPEVEIEFEVKETMKEANFRKMAPVANGIETSGLCSIM